MHRADAATCVGGLHMLLELHARICLLWIVDCANRQFGGKLMHVLQEDEIVKMTPDLFFFLLSIRDNMLVGVYTSGFACFT